MQRYQLIKEMRGPYSLSQRCRVLEVSRAGFKAWCAATPSPRAQETAQLDQQLKELFVQKRRAYGSPRLWVELRQRGWKCGENRVAKRMQALQLQARKRRRFVPRTTQSDPSAAVAPSQAEAEPAGRRLMLD